MWNETVFKKIAKRQLNIKELYSNSGQYYYKNGFHIPALIATLIAKKIYFMNNLNTYSVSKSELKIFLIC